MAKEARGAIVSVRISQDEQQRLRERADALGISVSELLRTTALSRIEGPAHPAARTTDTAGDQATGLFLNAPPGIQADAGVGVHWHAPAGAVVDGHTIIV